MYYLAHVAAGFGDILVSLFPLLLSQLSSLSYSPDLQWAIVTEGTYFYQLTCWLPCDTEGFSIERY